MSSDNRAWELTEKELWKGCWEDVVIVGDDCDNDVEEGIDYGYYESIYYNGFVLNHREEEDD